jgi:hypothetical protein
MEERTDEEQNLNQNLIEGVEGENPVINNISEVPNTNQSYPQIESNTDNYGSGSNAIYNNQPQPQLSDQIVSHLSPSDTIKMEYEKAIFSDFEKILQYDNFTNEFKPGLDLQLAYPYHFNPTLISLIRYRLKCDRCGTLKTTCYNLLCKNFICEKIIFGFKILMSLTSIFSFLTLFNFILFIKTLIFFFKNPGISFLLVILVYGLTLLFELQLLYYKLPKPITPEEFRKKIQKKIQTGQRIYFGDDKKVVPLVYNCYKDISGPLEMTKPFNLVKFAGRPGTYFLDGKTIREFNKLNEEFRLRGGNQKYYINYENSPAELNSEINYENQTLNSMFSSHEINELYFQDDELLYLAPQGFEKWNTIAIICFFCLVGEIYNNYFELNLSIKSYKIRKAIFFEEPDQEIEEKLFKYVPKITFQGNQMEFEQHSDKLNQNLVKPYFEKWDENYSEKNIKDYI